MAIKIQCRTCQASFQAADEHAGKTTKCPGCQEPLVIPARPSTAAKKTVPTSKTVTPVRSNGTAESSSEVEASPATTAMSREELTAQLLSGLDGTIERTRPTIGYRLGALLVAFVMILLPIIYIGLICLVGFGVYYHAVNHTGMLDSEVRGRGKALVFLAYLAPMVCGAVLVVFMIKPLFMRSANNTRTRSLVREREPLLFAFVDRICELVGAAKPKRIDLDCEVNASASFRKGMLSMFGSDLVLTIGMPLVAGLNTRQFAGVLAHEFGHFAQGAGMRLTYIIRSISFWLLRVVYQRDEADEWLENAAASTDLRIGWILYLAMFFVWLSRRVLWVLMMIGNLVGSYLLRQMEFDADRYETRLAGSEAFTQTVHELQRLGVATQAAYGDLREFYREGQLGDDLPRLIVSKTQKIPPELEKQLQESIKESETGWLDTHPSDRDRIANAERENTSGIFNIEMPATVLFEDFEAQSKATTWEFYRGEFDGKLDRSRLRPVSEMLQKSEKDQQAQAALERYSQGQWSVALPLRLSADSAGPPTDAKQTLANLKADRQKMLQMIESAKPAFETLHAEMESLTTSEQIRHCLRAGIAIKHEGKSLTKKDEDDFRKRISVSEKKIVHAKQSLQDYQEVASRRLGSALQLLFVSQIAERLPESEKWQNDSEAMLSCLRTLGETMETLIQCSRLQASANVLFERLSDQNDESIVIAIQGLGEKLFPITKQLHTAWARLPYPYQHAEKQITLAGYLIPTMPVKDELGSVFNASHQAVDSAFNLYAKLLSDLVFRAESVEAAVGLAKSAKPEPATAG